MAQYLEQKGFLVHVIKVSPWMNELLNNFKFEEKIIVARPRDLKITWFYGSKFADYSLFGSRNITHLIFLVTLQDHVINQSINEISSISLSTNVYLNFLNYLGDKF